MKTREQKRQEAEWRILRFEYVSARRVREIYKDEVRHGYVTYHPDDLREYLRNWRQAKAAFEQGVPQELQTEMLEGWT